jgi:dihydrofolate synthase/folylpolyglutamate synthase
MRFAELTELLFARANFGMKLGLARMQAALPLLGDPHRCAPVLHVAGTNGKGSTCAFTERSLRAAGLRTGLYTSPHLRHFCERIRLDGEPIGEEQAAGLMAELLARVPWALAGGPAGPDDGDGLTFFELTTLLGFLAFARAGVQVMVVEVGLGGRFDATNVVLPLACAVAPLGLEHQQYLGDTLELIAAEKAGIIKRGVPVVSAGQPLAAARVLEETALARGAPLWRPGRDYRFESREALPFCYGGPPAAGAAASCGDGWTVRPKALGLLGHHQRQNAALACALLEAAARRGLPVAPEHAEQGLQQTQWPGRLQRLPASDGAPLTLIDGAHNPHGARALAAALPALLAGRPLQLLLGLLTDKDARGVLEPLLPLATAVHLCAPRSPRALAPQALAAQVGQLGPRLPVSLHGSAAEALAAARRAAGSAGAVVGCGSLYLVGELLDAAEERSRDPVPSERL